MHSLTLSIRIVADFGALYYQATRKLKRATSLKFTIISAIIFIHCVCPACAEHVSQDTKFFKIFQRV
jgi:hypothetical protein